MQLQSNRSYTLAAFADTASWSTLESAGVTPAALQASVTAKIRERFTPRDTRVAVEVTVNPLVSDVASLRINVATDRAFSTDELSAAILDGLNAAAGVRGLARFSAHRVNGTARGIASLMTLNLIPASQIVVDEATVREGSDEAPPPRGSSAIGQAVGAVAGARTRSADPARDNTAVPATGQTGLPWYVTAGIVAAGVLAVAVATGYVVRSFK